MLCKKTKNSEKHEKIKKIQPKTKENNVVNLETQKNEPKVIEEKLNYIDAKHHY